MTLPVITTVALALLLHHYVFSFQRFTRALARNAAGSHANVADLQVLLTPFSMGALGWLSSVLVLASAVWLGFTFVWWWGVAFYAADLIVGGTLPAFPLRRHFSAMALRELSRHKHGPQASLVASLLDEAMKLSTGP